MGFINQAMSGIWSLTNGFLSMAISGREPSHVYIILFMETRSCMSWSMLMTFLIATNNVYYKKNQLDDLNDAYGIKDQGFLTQYLGVEAKQTDTRITMCQEQYATEILRKFGYDKAHAVGNRMEVNMRLMGDNTNNGQPAGTEFPYCEAIGLLMNPATSTRPYLRFVQGQLSRFVAHPNPKHVKTFERALRYLVGTLHDGIMYARQHYCMMRDQIMTNTTIGGYCGSTTGLRGHIG